MIRIKSIFILLIALSSLRNSTLQQSHAQDLSDSSTAVESQRDAFLASEGMLHPLAAALRARFSSMQPGPAKTELAEQLGKLYERMLNENPPAQERMKLEDLCKSLLEEVPDAQTPPLRLTLAIARYLPVEEFAERKSLRLSEPNEDVEAQRVLRSATVDFQEIAAKVGTRIKNLEERKQRGFASDDDFDANRSDLEYYRELRSKAAFYAGWSNYYLAMLTGSTEHAVKAMEQFGVLLNAMPGRAATVDRVPVELLVHDHLAKAVVGCALASSMLQNDIEPVRWLGLLQEAKDLPPSVQEQLLRRRIQVLAATRRWNDIEIAINRARQPDRSVAATPLSVPDARLLAVAAFEEMKSSQSSGGIRLLAESCAKIALGDLITRGEVGHVISIVKIYGTSLIGQDGFINTYVRALRAFDEVREAHRVASASGQSADSPTQSTDLINHYHAAAGLFVASTNAPDSQQFPVQRARSQVCAGLCYFYAGSLEQSVGFFEAAFAAATIEELKRDSLWYAIIALDLAISEGKVSLKPRREKLATLHIQTFPRSENSTRLLLEQIRAQRVAGQGAGMQDLEILLKVAPNSPLYESARRVACDIMYDAWRRASDKDRDFLALRFADTAEELLRTEFAKATSHDQPDARKLADIAVNRARRLADVLLLCASPDVSRAEAALSMVDSLTAFHGIDMASREDELVYRRLQIALAKRDLDQAQRELLRLRNLGGNYLAAGERLMYRRAADEWQLSPHDPRRATLVIASGTQVLGYKEWGKAAHAVVRDTVARAAEYLWESNRDTQMRSLAIKLDLQQLDEGHRTSSSLARLARLYESMTEYDAAAEYWLELLAATDERSETWYEYRYNSIRLIAHSSHEEARSILTQFRVLNPTISDAAWAAKFADLDQLITLTPVKQVATPAATTDTKSQEPMGQPQEGSPK